MPDSERVDLPPSFGRRAAPALVPLAFLPLSALGLALGRQPDWFQAALFAVVAAGIVIWAWWNRHRPALILDRVGVRDSKETLLVGWSDVALVWVGDEWPRGVPNNLRPLSLRVWDTPGMEFARRTGLRVDPRLVKPLVATTLSAAEAATLVRRFTLAPVHSGRPADLRRLLKQLRDPSRSSS